RPHRVPFSQGCAGVFVSLIRELSSGTGTTLNQDASESLLEQKRSILRGDCDATLVWVYFTRDAQGQNRVRDGRGRVWHRLLLFLIPPVYGRGEAPYPDRYGHSSVSPDHTRYNERD